MRRSSTRSTRCTAPASPTFCSARRSARRAPQALASCYSPCSSRARPRPLIITPMMTRPRPLVITPMSRGRGVNQKSNTNSSIVCILYGFAAGQLITHEDDNRRIRQRIPRKLFYRALPAVLGVRPTLPLQRRARGAKKQLYGIQNTCVHFTDITQHSSEPSRDYRLLDKGHARERLRSSTTVGFW